jgi:hypothetical protein
MKKILQIKFMLQAIAQVINFEAELFMDRLMSTDFYKLS